jgi:8-oxo-dGTP pyrophosphatase MutT (NUDIX family)
MRVRSGVLIVQHRSVALIARVRDGRRYYVVPGGGVEPGETPEQAAVREALEELGVHVALGPLAATVQRAERPQHYFLATIVGGTFGAGTGPEFGADVPSEKGTYRAAWLPLAALARSDVRPRRVAAALPAILAGTARLPLVIHDWR